MIFPYFTLQTLYVSFAVLLLYLLLLWTLSLFFQQHSLPLGQNQLWTMNGTSLKSKKDGWIPKEDLILKDSRIYFGNVINNTVLGINNINNIVEEDIDKNYLSQGQVWEKGNVNSFGYFTLRNVKSKSFLTAIASDDLAMGNS